MRFLALLLALGASAHLGAVSQAQTVVYALDGDGAGDAFGRSVALVGDVDGDGVVDLAIGAPGDDDSGAEAGSARVLSGRTGTVLFTFDGPGPGAEAGRGIAGAGDVNDDGTGDVIVGASLALVSGQPRGQAFVVSGLDQTVLHTFEGIAAGDRFGMAVAGVGDLDLDGHDDVAVGAPFDDSFATDAGRVVVYSGDTGSVLYTFEGETSESYFGFSVAAGGDVDGDGRPDVVVGAPSWPSNLSQGRVYVFSGSDGSTLHTFDGDANGDQLGYSVAGAGDIDDDGFQDVIAGADEESTMGSKAGMARLFNGRTGATIATKYGRFAGDRFGRSVAGAGDVDGDGVGDYAVGALRTDFGGSEAGSVTLFTGFDDSILFRHDGSAGDELGGSLAAGEDVNGDGVPDLLVGAALADAPGADSGRARVLSGVEMAFASDRHELSVTTFGTAAFALDSGPANAGSLYWVLGSVTGAVPGQDLGGIHLPLNFDPYHLLTIQKPFLGIFGTYIGLLDVDGRATASFTVPPTIDPGLAGITLHHAYIAAAVFGDIDLASNAVPVTLIP